MNDMENGVGVTSLILFYLMVSLAMTMREAVGMATTSLSFSPLPDRNLDHEKEKRETTLLVLVVASLENDST